MAIALACGPPSSFDNLVGRAPPDDGGPDGASDAPAGDGTVTDPTLKPPQPVSPPSVSWVNGSRPHFTWRLPPGATGAILEICPSRGCVTNVQTYEALGELDPPDLAPGVWYWRLRSKTADSIGKAYSPTWEVFVRGGVGNGQAGGSLVDIDGDGLPDLLVGIQYLIDAGAGSPPSVQVVACLGKKDGTYAIDFQGAPNPGAPVTVTDPPIAVVDVNGDGVSDVVLADFVPGGNARLSTFAGGGEFGLLPAKGDPVNVPPRSVLPSLRDSIDFDGDGYGDIVASTDKLLYTVFGTPRGLGPFNVLFSADDLDADSGARFNFPTLPFGGGFDRNGDGLGDVTLSWPLSEAAVFLFDGDTNRVSFPAPFVAGATRPSPPTTYTAGDMDGDGKPEVAYLATFGGKTSICLLKGTDSNNAAPVCWSPTTLPGGFASSLVAADLEADGKDEILVGSSSGGVDVLSLDSNGAIAATHLDTPYGARLTTILPGRPQAAVWASTRADATSIQVWTGRAPAGAPLTVSNMFGAPVALTPLLR